YTISLFSFFLYSCHSKRSTLFPYTTLFRSYFGRHRKEPEQRTPFCRFYPGNVLCHKWSEFTDAGVQQSLTDSRKPYVGASAAGRSEEHTSELQSRENLVCRLLLEKYNKYSV